MFVVILVLSIRRITLKGHVKLKTQNDSQLHNQPSTSTNSGFPAIISTHALLYAFNQMHRASPQLLIDIDIKLVNNDCMLLCMETTGWMLYSIIKSSGRRTRIMKMQRECLLNTVENGAHFEEGASDVSRCVEKEIVESELKKTNRQHWLCAKKKTVQRVGSFIYHPGSRQGSLLGHASTLQEPTVLSPKRSQYTGTVP